VALPRRPPSGNFVITRLHARYSKEALGDDLVFREAPPIVGGREFLQTDGKLEQGARPDSTNNFQARYAIRHPWTGPIACSHPRRGVWGANPAGGSGPIQPAVKIGFTPRAGAITLASFVHGAVPPETFLSSGGATPPLLVGAGSSIAATPSDEDASSAASSAPIATDAASTAAPPPPSTPPSSSGCAGCATAPGGTSMATALSALAAIAAGRLRRRRR
jgi:MYXO-CTERM domain-containing protein